MAALFEPEGYFDSDNLISNEGAYLKILPDLKRQGISGGAYIGVGPDQNYSYIAQIKPQPIVQLIQQFLEDGSAGKNSRHWKLILYSRQH